MTLILEPDRSGVVEVADHRAIRSALANLPGDPQREVVTRRDGSSLTARWDNAIGIVLEHRTGSDVREDGTPFLSSRRAESALTSFARGTTGWRSTLSWYKVRSFRNPKHLMRLASRTTLPILVVLTVVVYLWSRTGGSDTVPMTPTIAGVVRPSGPRWRSAEPWTTSIGVIFSPAVKPSTSITFGPVWCYSRWAFCSSSALRSHDPCT